MTLAVRSFHKRGAARCTSHIGYLLISYAKYGKEINKFNNVLTDLTDKQQQIVTESHQINVKNKLKVSWHYFFRLQ